MTKYRLDRDPDTGNPCMVADPDGIYYSAGEVDREITKYQQQRFYFDKDGVLRPVEGHTTSEIRLAANMLSMQEKNEKREDLIRRMAGMMMRARPETIKVAGPYADPFDPKFLIGCPFCVTAEQSNEKILTTLEHEDDCPWFQIIKEAEQCAGIEFNDILDMFAVDPNIEKWQKAWREANGTGVMTQEALYPEWLAKLDGTWMEETYAAGTHDGGTVPEGDRPSTGPASARESEDHSE